MPRASDTRRAITIYPDTEMAAWIESLAKRELRSMNKQVLILLEKARKGTNGRH